MPTPALLPFLFYTRRHAPAARLVPFPFYARRSVAPAVVVSPRLLPYAFYDRRTAAPAILVPRFLLPFKYYVRRSVPPAPVVIPPRLLPFVFYARWSGAIGIDPILVDPTWYMLGLPRMPAGRRDRDAYREIEAILAALGEFDDVTFGAVPERATTSQEVGLLATITPWTYRQTNDANAERKIRTVTYRLTLVDRNGDTDAAYETLDRLDSVVHNALEGQEYGFCQPNLSHLGDGQYDDSAKPDIRLEMAGTFTYVVNQASTKYDEVV